MESIVLYKFVLIDEKDNVCMCSKETYKTCPIRISEDLECRECAIRFTPLKENPDVVYDDNITSLSEKLRNKRSSFKETLGHLGRFK